MAQRIPLIACGVRSNFRLNSRRPARVAATRERHQTVNQKRTALVALPVLLALTVTGCSSIEPAENVAGGGDSVAEEESTAEEEASAAEIGARDNPAPAGTVVEVSSMSGVAEYQASIGPVALNANDVVAAANEFNEPAPGGFQYMMFPVTYTYIGSETGLPWADVNIEFVLAAGTTHKAYDASVYVENPLTEVNELYPQASATGNEVILVPSAVVEAGLLAISDAFGTEKFFLKLA